jgi:hypothetical protein
MLSVRRLMMLAATLLAAFTSFAQHSGVLLGVAGPSTNPDSDTQSFETIRAPQYQTLWIAADVSEEIKVLATLPEIIVPRKDGFWHVGVKQVCEFDGSDFPNERLEHKIWTAPATKAATVEQTNPCTPHKPEDYAPPYNRTEADKNKISQCGFALVNLLFVSPELISMSTYTGQSDDCEVRGGRYNIDFGVRNFDSDQPLGFGELLGASAHAAYEHALPKTAVGDSGEDCGEADPNNDVGWRIEHKSGRWQPYIHQDLGYFGCGADAQISFPLRAALTGNVSPAPDLKQLRTKIPDIADAYVSPAGDLLVAASSTETKIFELHAGVPGKLLLKLPAQGIVLAQWATGKHVQDWTTQLEALEKQKLPEPTIRLKKPAASKTWAPHFSRLFREVRFAICQ